MNRTFRYFSAIVFFLCLHFVGRSQQTNNDTIPSYIKGKQAVGVQTTGDLPPNVSDSGRTHRNHKQPKVYAVDSLGRRKHDPRKATLYSTFAPGLGQIYNRKYWKVPLVWAAVGIPVYTFFYNRSWYNKCQFAISIMDRAAATGVTVPADLAAKVDPQLRTFITYNDESSLRTYRNEFRKDEDYSVLFFLLFWGLNIVDATVDAHLMYFDVSDQLSVHLQQPQALPTASTTTFGGMAGIGLAFELHKIKHRPISTP